MKGTMTGKYPITGKDGEIDRYIAFDFGVCDICGSGGRKEKSTKTYKDPIPTTITWTTKPLLASLFAHRKGLPPVLDGWFCYQCMDVVHGLSVAKEKPSPSHSYSGDIQE